MPKAPCPVTREEFNKHAQRLRVKIGEDEFTLGPKQFTTGSMGWGHQGKTTILINGHLVEVTIGLNITVNNSKELPPIGE